MLTLGIETSGHAGTIALADGGRILAERKLSATGRRHARTLVPEIGELVKDIGRTIQDVEGIAVGLGPGSFTGLRVGVVCAKTLAFALSRPIVGVDTFAAIAQSLPDDIEDAWIVDDALRGDVYCGHYLRSGRDWICVQSPMLASMSRWLQSISEKGILAGPSIDRFRREFAGVVVRSLFVVEPKAREVAVIGERRLDSGSVDDCWTLEPLYIRRSAAEEKAESMRDSP